MQRSRKTRAFTLFEMMTVMVVATILTTIGLVGIADVIKQSRYRADRTRVYQDVREARDRAKRGMWHLTVNEIGTPGVDANKLEFRLGTACSLGTPWIVEYPAIDFNADHTICMLEAATPVAAEFVEFKPMGSPPLTPSDRLWGRADGSLEDDWNEFPDEGCLEANPSGDPDHSGRKCGD